MNRETEDLLDILRALVAADTTNPPGNESRAAAVFRDFFESIDIPYDVYEKEPGRANIIGRIGRGRPELLIACHLDVVPSGEGWTSDPFALRVEGDRAYGRGVNDNKGPAAGMLLAAKKIVESGVEPGGTLLVAGVADEECGNACGARYLLEEAGIRPDYVVTPDSAGHMEEIDLGEKGFVAFRICCRGLAAHGSTPAKGVNAVLAMADLLSAMSGDGAPTTPHAHFSPATMNVGRMSGGTVVNVVPESAEAEVEFRILPGTSVADLEAFVDGHIAAAAERCPGARFEREIFRSMPPHEVDAESALVEGAQAASMKVYGRPMRPIYIGGVTIAKEFALAGVPAVAFGPGSADAAHKADEWIETAELVPFADFIVELTSLLLFAGRG